MPPKSFRGALDDGRRISILARAAKRGSEVQPQPSSARHWLDGSEWACVVKQELKCPSRVPEFWREYAVI